MEDWINRSWTAERKKILEEVLRHIGMMMHVHDPDSAMEVIEKYRLTGTVEFLDKEVKND